MRRIAHVSDLHFGRHQPAIARALLAELNALAPAVVVVSGDLTQRARRDQFAEARVWLQKLEAPRLVVPGNHDIPLYDVVTRAVAPRERFLRSIDGVGVGAFVDDEVAALGIDTTARWTIARGILGEAETERAATWFSRHPRHWRLLVAHHPLIVPARFADDRAHGAARRLPRLERSGVDLVLTGHLHIPHSEGPAGRDPAHRPIAVHAGTCMSTRLRGEPNGYNVLTLDESSVTITHRAWAGDRFVDDASKHYRRERPGGPVRKATVSAVGRND